MPSATRSAGVPAAIASRIVAPECLEQLIAAAVGDRHGHGDRTVCAGQRSRTFDSLREPGREEVATTDDPQVDRDARPATT